MEHTSVPMASRTLRAIRSRAERRSGALFTSWTMRRRVSSTLAPPPQAPHHRRQFAQRTYIDAALEGHHLAHRIPVADPTPFVEFRGAGGSQINGGFVAGEAQQEPFLALADAIWLVGVALAAQESAWQAIAEPAFGAAHHLHVAFAQPHFFVELAVQGLFRGFAGQD